jgi:hypothetical protein
MDEINRYSRNHVSNTMEPSDDGKWVRYKDYVNALLKEARKLQPAKFKVGDLITTQECIDWVCTDSHVITEISYDHDEKEWVYSYVIYGAKRKTVESNAKLFQVPAEIIPTIKEHEWVKGICNGISFGPSSVYTYNVTGDISAGCTDLTVTNKIVNYLITHIERCNQPEVK